MFVGFQIFANLSNSIWSKCQFPRVAESRIVDVTARAKCLENWQFRLKNRTVFRGIKAQAKKKDFSCWSCVYQWFQSSANHHRLLHINFCQRVKLGEWDTRLAEVKGRRAPRFRHLRFKCFHSSNRVAAVRLPISKQRVHLVRMHQACTHYIIVQHGLVVVKACSCPVMFEFWNSVEWTHTGSAALSHTLADVWAYAGMGLLASSGTKVVWQHFKSLQATQYSPCLKCSISYPVDTKSTGSLMKAQWTLTWDNNIHWQRSEKHNSPFSGCQSRVLLQVVATLGIHTSPLSWTAAARTPEDAHEYVPRFDLSLVNQCVQIKLGSWVQPAPLVHSELKLSLGLEQLYVCKPKLDMQCIEILSRALTRILAVSNAMPPNAS